MNQDPQMQPQLQQNPQAVQSKQFYFYFLDHNITILTVLWVTEIILHEQTFSPGACEGFRALLVYDYYCDMGEHYG